MHERDEIRIVKSGEVTTSHRYSAKFGSMVTATQTANQEIAVTRKPNDTGKEPPGGRALERLRQFEDARRPVDGTPGKGKRQDPKEEPCTPEETPKRSRKGGDHEEPD